MTPTKYRLWLPNENRMAEWDEVKHMPCSVLTSKYASQFTGEHDRLGNEIYANDILQLINHAGWRVEIKNPKNRKVIAWVTSSSKVGWNFGTGLQGVIHGEIIGNIFQNKDLLP